MRPKMKLSTAVDLIPNPAPALSRRMEKKNKRRAAELRVKKAAGAAPPSRITYRGESGCHCLCIMM